MTVFRSASSYPVSNRVGRVDAAYVSTMPSFAPQTLGIFPPNTDSLGGTMTANGGQFQRVATTLVEDNSQSKPVTVIRSWPVGAAADAAPTSTKGYNADGSPYTGSLGSLKAPA